MRSWRPGWEHRVPGTGAIIAASTAEVTVRFEPRAPDRSVASDLVRHLQDRRANQPPHERTLLQWTFMYVLYAEDGVRDHLGRSEGLRVVEAAFGNDFVGPPNGVDVSLDELVEAAIAALLDERGRVEQ
jgi:hypothetical protein